MFEDLKKCRTFKEIFQTLPSGWDQQAASVVLSMWVLLPLLMLPMFYIFVGDAVAMRSVFYALIQTAGVISTAFVVIQISGKLLTRNYDIRKAVRHSPWHFLLLLMLAWALLSALLSDNVPKAFWGDFYYHEGFVNYCFYAAALYAATLLPEKLKARIIKLFVWTSFAICVVFLAKYCNVGFVADFIRENEYPMAYYNGTNVFGYLLSLSVLVLAGVVVSKTEKHRLLYCFILAFEIYTLIMNNTFGSYLAVVFALFIAVPLIWIRDGKLSLHVILPLLVFLATNILYYVLMNVIGLSALIGLNFNELSLDLRRVFMDTNNAGSAGSGRFEIWRKTILAIPERPWFGYGHDQTIEIFSLGSPSYHRPHNEILQHALFLGIPAALLYVSSLFWLFIHQLKNLRQLNQTTIIAAFAVIGYFISSMFGNTTPWTTVFFFIFLAFAADQSADQSPV